MNVGFAPDLHKPFPVPCNEAHEIGLSPLFSGGEGGIRTHGTRKGSTVFETARFNRSRTSPCPPIYLIVQSLATKLPSMAVSSPPAPSLHRLKRLRRFDTVSPMRTSFLIRCSTAVLFAGGLWIAY